MTIGIFGDSFADPRHGHPAAPSYSKYAWLYHLNHPVHTHACVGSSFYYSYNKFINNYKKYEKNIFVVTHFSRIPIDPTNYVENNLKWLLSCGSAESASIIKPTLHNIDHLPICDAVKGWYEHLRPLWPFDHIGRLMFDEIKRLRPDTIFIPAFSPTKFFKEIQITGPSMTDYMNLTIQSLNPNYSGLDPYLEVVNVIPENILICHLSI